MAAEPLRREPDAERREPRRFETVAAYGPSPGRPWTIGSFVLAALGFVLSPLIGGALGILSGWQGLRRGDPLARWAIGVNVALIVLGLVLAVILAYG